MRKQKIMQALVILALLVILPSTLATFGTDINVISVGHPTIVELICVPGQGYSCHSINYSVDGASWTHSYDSDINIIINSDGNHEIRYYSIGKCCSGEVCNYAVEPMNVEWVLTDTEPPTTTDDAPAEWQANDVVVTLSCSDSVSGCAATYYCVDSNATCTPTTLGTTVNITCAEGETCLRYVRYYSVDNADNNEAIKTSTQVKIDKTPPTIDVNSPTDNEQFASVIYVRFTADRGQGSPIDLSSIRVLIDGSESDDFNRDSHCTENDGSYTCAYYEYVQFAKDYNVSIIVSDSIGYTSQRDIITSVYATYSLEGYTIEPSASTSGTTYKALDVGIGSPAGALNTDTYSTQLGFAAIFRNIPPEIVYDSNEYGYVSGTFQISFYVRDYESEELHAKIAYSTSQGQFQNIIASDLNLDNYESIANLSCEGTDWRFLTLCTYTWDLTSVSDGNYYIDINIWDKQGDSNSYSTAYQLCVDNTPPAIDVNSPADDESFSSAAYIKFTVDRGQGSPIDLSSIRVLIDGSESDDFNRDLHCIESSGSYTCTYYEYVRFTDDYNIAIIAADSIGYVSQVDRNVFIYTEYNLEGYTIEPSISMQSTNYSMIDVGLGNMGGTTCYSSSCIDIGFPSIFRNIPPTLLYAGYEQGYFNGTFEIRFYASDYEMEELHSKFAYSSTKGAFQNSIVDDLNLNNYANIAELTCEDTDWRYAQLCTYSWDTTGIADGNYYLDLNLWDIQGGSDSYSTQYTLCIDNNAPGINITTPDENKSTSNPTISFILVHNGCAPIVLSSVQVKINGSAASFNYASDCNASGLNYVCSFYQTGLSEGDYNLSIIVSDLTGNSRQVDRNFHFVPEVGVSSIMPSGTLESGTITISFTVHNTMLDNLYASIYYSSISAGKLGFEKAIATDLNLNAYESVANLSCDSNDWWPPVQCTYTWDASSITDGNYYIDIEVQNGTGLEDQDTSLKQFLLDNTTPSASVTDVSSTTTYSDTVYLNCSDSGSGCVATKWYYFSATQSCSSTKSDYNYSTTSNSITITDDHNDYICLWVEDRVGLHATAVSDQLHVSATSWGITKGASQTITQISSDLNNTCNFTVTGEINLACEFQSFVKIRQSAADINSTYTGTPTLVESPEKPIKVVLEEAITSFYNEDYFIKFESSTRTITSQGNEQDYPVTIVRRRIVPQLTADGQLDVGTLIIKIRKK